MTAPALLIIGAIVVVNHNELRQAALNRGVNGTNAEMVLYELRLRFVEAQGEEKRIITP